jgi:hypothetical protein
MAGRSNFNSKQANRRGNAYDQVAEKIESWIRDFAPNFIYNKVIAARNMDQINALANEKAESEKNKLEKELLIYGQFYNQKNFHFSLVRHPFQRLILVVIKNQNHF